MKCWIFGFFITAALVGCDDRPSVPQSVIDQANKQNHPDSGPKIPTTQELLTAPRVKTVLQPLPLTLDLPPGWGRDPVVPTAHLFKGYAPSGQIEIQLITRTSMTQDQLDRLVAGAKKEMDQHPDSILKADLHKMGNVLVFERQSVGKPLPYTSYDADNHPHITNESIFTWNITALIPSNGGFQTYEINFIGLRKSQYDNDQKFLNGIMDTLNYDASVATPSTVPAL